ncbi:MAG TPA: T9SS type A sorting domain-containing protein [bacterium]|nr:T9SS type A sorting domain-containing protein [bacterium]HPN46250.1 T9SS type A sorting domain-containing protein [bacterium]
MKNSLLVIFICITFMTQSLWAFIGSGSGTEGSPYIVTSAAELNDVRNDLTAYYRQTANISLSGYDSWTPIGTGSATSTAFTGTYDGNGHKVTGLTITSYSSAGAGLFGYNRGTIKNLGVSGSVSATATSAGILAGLNYYGTMQNCYTEGSVTSSSNYVGGFVGSCSYSTTGITQCYSTATVTATGAGSMNVGGFVGHTNNSGATISECYCTGNVTNNNTTSANANTGGFVGASALTISNCYATGNVSCSGSRIGGFCGFASYNTPISYCYSTGTVTGGSTIGGFVGYYNTGTFTSCFFNHDNANMSSYGGYATSAPTGITAATTADMKTASTYSSWSTSYWNLTNGSYPTLKCFDESLPVELSSFTATVQGNTIVLNWQTESETDNLGFTLERAEGDGAWQQIASYQTSDALKGQGNTSTTTSYTWTDAGVAPNSGYRYRLGDVNVAGTVTMHSPIAVTMTALPQSTELLNAYPNPFNPETTINYQLHKDSQVTITVYDLLGRKVKTLIDEQQAAGSYRTLWNGTDNSGAKAASGAYLVRMETQEVTQIQKVLLLK